MKAKTIDNSPHGWDTCIYDNEDCPMGYYVDDLPDKERADKYTNIFNLELSSHVAKETEKLQAEIDYIKREKLSIHLLIDEITDGDCLKQSKAKLSAEIKELKAEVQKVDYAYRNMTRRYRKAIDKMEAQNENVTNLQQTISHLNKMYNQAINDLTISQEKVERVKGMNETLLRVAKLYSGEISDTTTCPLHEQVFCLKGCGTDTCMYHPNNR